VLDAFTSVHWQGLLVQNSAIARYTGTRVAGKACRASITAKIYISLGIYKVKICFQFFCIDADPIDCTSE
jgi:hypothetical protein